MEEQCEIHTYTVRKKSCLGGNGMIRKTQPTNRDMELVTKEDRIPERNNKHLLIEHEI